MSGAVGVPGAAAPRPLLECDRITRGNVAQLAAALAAGGCVAEVVRKDGFSKYYISAVDSYDASTFSVCRHRVFFRYDADGSGPFYARFSHGGDEHTDYFENEHIYRLHAWELQGWRSGGEVYPPMAGSVVCAAAAAAFREGFASGAMGAPWACDS